MTTPRLRHQTEGPLVVAIWAGEDESSRADLFWTSGSVSPWVQQIPLDDLDRTRSEPSGLIRSDVSVETQDSPQADDVDNLVHTFPHIPVATAVVLAEPSARDTFIQQIFAYQRLRSFFATDWTLGDLVALHTREKLLLRSHDEVSYQELGRLVANAKSADPEALKVAYLELFMRAMAHPATLGSHGNVLEHMIGFLKRVDDEIGRAHMIETIDLYRRELVPLIVPVTLMRHLCVRHEQTVFLESSYLSPHPGELLLRNHA